MVDAVLQFLKSHVEGALACLAYSYRTFSVGESVTFALMDQVEDNLNEHKHGANGVASILSEIGLVTASGASMDFAIPSTATEIIIAVSGISTNGVTDYYIQLGDSGGVETTGYLGALTAFGGATVSTIQWPTTAAILYASGVATNIVRGLIFLNLENATTNTWIISGRVANSNATASQITVGSKALSGALTTLRIKTQNGTDVFDAGTINVLYN